MSLLRANLRLLAHVRREISATSIGGMPSHFGHFSRARVGSSNALQR